MKIHFEHGKTAFDFERRPMPQERFATLYRLAGFAIYGGVVVALVHMIDVWGFVWSLAGLMVAGIYKLIVKGFNI